MASDDETGCAVCCGFFIIIMVLKYLSDNWKYIGTRLPGIFYWLFVLAIMGCIINELYKAIDKPVKITGSSISLLSFGIILFLILMAAVM